MSKIFDRAQEAFFNRKMPSFEEVREAMIPFEILGVSQTAARKKQDIERKSRAETLIRFLEGFSPMVQSFGSEGLSTFVSEVVDRALSLQHDAPYALRVARSLNTVMLGRQTVSDHALMTLRHAAEWVEVDEKAGNLERQEVSRILLSRLSSTREVTHEVKQGRDLVSRMTRQPNVLAS